MVRFGLVVMYVLLTVGCRLGMGIPNFTPLLAFSLFAGACLPNRYVAYFLPLGILFATDLYLGIHATMFFTYLSVFLISLGGSWMSQTQSWRGLTLGAVGSSVLFFVLSNFGVWGLTSLYPHDWQGLLSCYEAGIPFYRATFASTVLFSYLFFFGYAKATAREQEGSLATSRL